MIAREERFVLKAHLACLLDGVDQGHISLASASRFRDVLAVRLRTRGFLDEGLKPTAKPLTAAAIWKQFAQAAKQVGNELDSTKVPHKLSDLRQPGPVFGKTPTITVAELKYQDALIREGAADLRLPTLARIRRNNIAVLRDRDQIRDCARALKHRLLKMTPAPAGYLKGTKETTVWVVPVLDPISDLVNAPQPHILEQLQTTTLRNILGLWNYIGPKTSPLAVFFLEPRATVHAPNVITANGYARFRHRTKKFMAMAPTAGLTYNLDQRALQATPGVPEIVTVGVELSHVTDVVACGCPDQLLLTPPDRRDAFRNYWAYLADKRSFNRILAELELRIP